jgi:hypothetical protein
VSAVRTAPALLLPTDLERLEQRARELATGQLETVHDDAATRLVLFRLMGLPCALDATPVERAVARLLGPVGVPTAGGRDRTVAFVEEQPLPVADLSGTLAGRERLPSELAGLPALVVATRDGPVAVAVEGPLDLREERLAGTAAEQWSGAAGMRLAGRLADGTSVLDTGWLLEWAGKAAHA